MNGKVARTGRARLVVAGVLALGLLLAGCGGDDGRETHETGAETTAAEAAEAPERPEGVGDLTLLTHEEGVGERPVFEWEAVDDAAGYQLVLLDAEGVPYWAWEGSGTSVPLGGGDSPRPEELEGPRLTEAMTWTVSAHDAGGRLLALSDHRPIAP